MVERLLGGDWETVHAICAPPGSGKSTIALATAMIHAEDGHPVTILTHQKALQRQYLDYGLPGVRSATGRQNWDCVLDADFVHYNTKADMAPCVAGYTCDHSTTEEGFPPTSIVCPYYRQREIAAEAMIRVLNYSYFFLSKKKFYSEMLICDEGHRLDKAILEANAVRLSVADQHRLHSWGTPLPDIPEGKQLLELPGFKSWVTSALMAASEAKKAAANRDEEFAVRMLVYDLLQLLLLGDATTVVIGGNQFLPVLPEEHAQRTMLSGLQEWGGRLILMSASLFNPEYTLARLGMSRPVQYTELPSVFPLKNRPIYAMPSITLNRETTQDPTVLRRLANLCDDIIEGHGTQKGVIHCASFQLGREIALRSKYASRMILAEPGEPHADRFIQSEDGVYVSPSAYEGYDFRGDLCRFNIIAKLNWPNRGDPVTALQLSLIPEYNDHETTSAFVQAAGRGNRDEDDWCSTYVLDRSFMRLWERNWQKMPAHTRDAIKFPGGGN